MGGSLSFTQSELTIAAGVVTPTRSNHSIDTQSDAASDDLDTMNVGSTADGAIIIVTPENASRVVTLKNANGGSGQMLLAAERDVAMNDANFHYLFVRDGTGWYEIKNSAVQETLVQRVYASLTTVATGSTQMVLDDSIPQSGEGDEYLTCAITPRYSSSRLRITVQLHVSNASTASIVSALFRDSGADAIAAFKPPAQSTAAMVSTSGVHEMASPGTTATTFKLRAGGTSAGTTTVNGASGARLFGGVAITAIIIDEIYSFL